MGDFRYIAEKLCFISTSHVFGSNTLASFWEALRQGIQNMITVFSTKAIWYKTHRELLDTLKWQEDAPAKHCLNQAFACEMNPSAMKEEPGVCTLLLENIYVDDILVTGARKEIMERLLAAIIKACDLWSIQHSHPPMPAIT
jgi:hypothetical protein